MANIEAMSRVASDEAYVLAICDEVFGEISEKQKRFEFLRGDPGKNGARRKLPIDAYYSGLSIAIEYREQQHAKAVAHFDKPNRLTISGVHRGEQRRLYDLRRRDVLPANGIRLIEIDCTDLAHNNRHRLVRDRVRDRQVIEGMLGPLRIAGNYHAASF
ncbi:hypothetical protein [Mesorhizobium loti]|uniref:hypothetical protein n=1 Tax=Rhizobium loti TaxID=381 RepID=UPI001C00DE81|nr:hypothetical protein [Mesorhizobium loti]